MKIKRKGGEGKLNRENEKKMRNQEKKGEHIRMIRNVYNE